jgi:hypothetical protein
VFSEVLDLKPTSGLYLKNSAQLSSVLTPRTVSVLPQSFLVVVGLAINKVRVPEGRLKLVLGCYQSGVPDRFG